MAYSLEIIRPTFTAIANTYHSKEIGTATKRRALLADLQRAALMCEAYALHASEAAPEQAATEARTIREALTTFAGMFYNTPDGDPLKEELNKILTGLRQTLKAYNIESESREMNAFTRAMEAASSDQPTPADLDFFEECAQMPDLRNEAI